MSLKLTNAVVVREREMFGGISRRIFVVSIPNPKDVECQYQDHSLE